MSSLPLGPTSNVFCLPTVTPYQILNFLRTGMGPVFSKWLYHFTFPHQCISFYSSTFSSILVILCLLYFIYPNEHVVVYCDFYRDFPNTNDVDHLHIFMAICISSLENCLFISFAYFSTGFAFFATELYFSNILQIQIAYHIQDLQNFLPYRGTWVAQSVEHPTSALAMISRFVDSSPISGSTLSMEPAWDYLPPSLSAPLPLAHTCLLGLSLSLSLSLKLKKIKII